MVAESPIVVAESAIVVAESANVVAESPIVVAASPNVMAESANVVAESPNLVSESPNVVAESADVVAEFPIVLDPRWGPLAKNHRPEPHVFRPQDMGEKPIQPHIMLYMISSAPGFQLSALEHGDYMWLWKITVLWWPSFFAFRGHLVQNDVPRFSTPDDARIEITYISYITDLINLRRKNWNRMRERCWKFARFKFSFWRIFG